MDAIIGATVAVTVRFEYPLGSGRLVSPDSIEATIEAPDGTKTTPTPTEVSEGIWRAVFVPDQAKKWKARVVGTGFDDDSEAIGVAEVAFNVAASKLST